MSLRQVLFRPNVLLFLFAFTTTGSALIYGEGQFLSALESKDICNAGPCRDETTFKTNLEQFWMPLIGNFILPTAMLIGSLTDRWGFAFTSLLNIASIQAFVVALWLLPLHGQVLTLFLYSLSNAAVFTTQNIYICAEGGEHIGMLFGVSNLALGAGNLVSAYLNSNPFGDSAESDAVSLKVSSIIWFIACCPLYLWPAVELARSRRKGAAGRLLGQEVAAETGATAGVQMAQPV